MKVTLEVQHKTELTAIGYSDDGDEIDIPEERLAAAIALVKVKDPIVTEASGGGWDIPLTEGGVIWVGEPEEASITDCRSPHEAIYFATEAAKRGETAIITVSPDPSPYWIGVQGLIKIARGEKLEPLSEEEYNALHMLPFVEPGGLYG